MLSTRSRKSAGMRIRCSHPARQTRSGENDRTAANTRSENVSDGIRSTTRTGMPAARARSTPTTSPRLETTPARVAARRPSRVRSIRFCSVVPDPLMSPTSRTPKPPGWPALHRRSTMVYPETNTAARPAGPRSPTARRMEGIFPELTRRFDATKPLGYLNFATGSPDARFRKFLADVFGHLGDVPVREPWAVAGAWLLRSLDELERSGSAAFRDAAQARLVVTAAFEHLPGVYRAHHSDLLAHQPDGQLFTAYFLARASEAVLRDRAKRPDAGPEALAAAAVSALNEYVGYRPIAVLETRPQTDYYPHEKVCPVPLYFPGSGVAPGRYADLIRPALELIAQTDPALREEACLDPDRLDELSLDPRAADHFHPVNKRPNVLFGEWDPHRIDSRGYYRRFVLRQPTLDALLTWIGEGPAGEPSERRFEAAAVLAGTILMGAGVSGAGPTYYDSTVTLATLVQRIARYRDEFYRRLLASLPGRHGERLRDEASK